LKGPVAASLVLLLARLVAVPALSDPVMGAVPDRLHLVVPPTYLVLAPLFTLWDGVSMLSLSRLNGFIIGLALLYLFWRVIRYLTRDRIPWWSELRALISSLALLSLFVLVGAVWHRPMLRLEGAASDEMIVDFHSHTYVSHDVRNTWMRGFDAEASRRWHRRAGFQAFFITDHNSVAGLRAHRLTSSPVICPGTEVSAWHSHIVLLGDSVPVDRKRFDSSEQQLLQLLRGSGAEYGALTLASLPEYRRNLWDRLDSLIAAGLDGFEIVNASPKGNELTRAERDSVVRLARQSNRFVAGVSDSHGWGATSMVWNLVPLPQGPENPCAKILHRLGDGFGALRIVERHRLRPDAWWPLWLSPLGVVWETWRSMGWALTWSWLGWIWVWTAMAIVSRARLSQRSKSRLAEEPAGEQDTP
jgi:hypothetical protein